MQKETAAETQKEIKRQGKKENHVSESDQLQLTFKNPNYVFRQTH